MKIACKCGCILTKDLYETKKWKINLAIIPIDNTSMDNKEYTEYNFEIKPGTFIQDRSRYISFFGKLQKRSSPTSYLINKSDMIDQAQLKYRKGFGCCGNAFTEFHCPECKKEVGEQNLDCYQSKAVSLYIKETIRKYKS